VYEVVLVRLGGQMSETVTLHRDYPLRASTVRAGFAIGGGPGQMVDVTIDPIGAGSRVTVSDSGLQNAEMCGIGGRRASPPRRGSRAGRIVKTSVPPDKLRQHEQLVGYGGRATRQ